MTKILLNSEKNIDSVNIDSYTKIQLENEFKEIVEFDIRKVISQTEVFEEEREKNEIYRIYGKINYLSLLNGLKLDYATVFNFFDKKKYPNECKNIFNSFKVYLVKPSKETKERVEIENKELNNFGRYFEVIATGFDIEIYNAGFSKNIFGEQEYGFNFEIDFDISNEKDGFNFPITDFFLYFEYIPDKTKNEKLYRSVWDDDGKYNKHVEYTPIELFHGSLILGDVIYYEKNIYKQTIIADQKYIILTPVGGGNSLEWEYNPFIPIKLRYLSPNISKKNIKTTSYDQLISIPEHANNIDNNGNVVWREILEQGYFDPITGVGVDYPFINNKRYLYTNIILDIVPNLSHQYTKDIFNNIYFNDAENETIKTTPKKQPENIGQTCR
jgi:hypothetical protein